MYTGSPNLMTTRENGLGIMNLSQLLNIHLFSEDVIVGTIAFPDTCAILRIPGLTTPKGFWGRPRCVRFCVPLWKAP